MKKFITIWIGCSLALAASAMAQQDQAKSKKKHEQAQAVKQAQAAKRAPAAKPAKTARNVQAAPHVNKPEPHAAAPHRQAEQRNRAAKPKANAQTTQHRNEANAVRKNANTHTRNEHADQQTQVIRAAKAKQPKQANRANQQANRQNARAAKKPDARTVQQIKAQNANFHARPRPQQIQSVNYRKNYRIHGSQHWQGAHYAAFRSYHPGWHDRGWYHSRYNRIVLIGGGYYFWNSGYWYPAWGYSPTESYYAYDGPIYTGTVAETPDRVIANVQAVLQEQGYYQGEVDGLLGPLTRDALTAYQSDHGLYTTAAIDQPTLDSLGMGS